MPKCPTTDRPARQSTPAIVYQPLGDSMPDLLVFAIAGILWINVVFIGFRMWMAREGRADSRQAVRERRRSPR